MSYDGQTEIVVINELAKFPEPDALTKYLRMIEERVKGLAFDMSDKKSRETCRSTAAGVTHDKTYLVKLGNAAIADQKQAIKLATAEIKRADDFLTEVARKVREPLTIWETAEKEREKAEKEYADDFDAAIIENAQFDNRKKQEADEARLKAERAAFEAEKAETARKQKEESDRLAKIEADLKAEKDKLAKEEAARKAAAEKAEREARIAAEAKAKAEKEAQEKIERERAAAEQKRLADIKAVEIKAEADRQAIIDAQKEKDRKAAERIAKDKAEADRIKAENDKRVADEAHRAQIIAEIKAAFKLKCNLDDIEAHDVALAIETGNIPYVSINFGAITADDF